VGIEFLGDGFGGFFEFFEEAGRDSEEVYACEGFDLPGLHDEI
jgi:hypothetical protein